MKRLRRQVAFYIRFDSKRELFCIEGSTRGAERRELTRAELLKEANEKLVAGVTKHPDEWHGIYSEAR